MRTLPVLLTRPRADALRLADELRAAGVQRIEVSPLMRIVATGPLPELSGGIILTSGNAVDTYVELKGPKGLPTWTVGPRTADRARAAGLDVQGTAPDAEALGQAIPETAPPLMHLRGAVARGDLAVALRARGLTADEAVIYRQDGIALTAAAADLLRAGPVVVPLYSPRSAELFFQACPHTAYGNLRIIALSPAVASASPVPPVEQAETPDGSAMVRAVLRYFTTMDG